MTASWALFEAEIRSILADQQPRLVHVLYFDTEVRWCLFRELTAQVGEKDECPGLDALFPKPSEARPKVGPAAAYRVE
jgi:hypothetical protein